MPTILMNYAPFEIKGWIFPQPRDGNYDDGLSKARFKVVYYYRRAQVGKSFVHKRNYRVMKRLLIEYVNFIMYEPKRFFRTVF